MPAGLSVPHCPRKRSERTRLHPKKTIADITLMHATQIAVPREAAVREPEHLPCISCCAAAAAVCASLSAACSLSRRARLCSRGRSVCARFCAALSEALVAASRPYQKDATSWPTTVSIGAVIIPSSHELKKAAGYFPERLLVLIQMKARDCS